MLKENASNADVLARLDVERAWWEDVLTSLPVEQMSLPGLAGEWSLKDVIGHLSGWQRRTLDRLRAGCRGEPEPLPPWPMEIESIADEDEAVEQINAWIHESNRNRPVEDVIAQSRSQWDELRALVDTMPVDVLNQRDRFPLLDGASLGQSVISGYLFEHFREEHEPGIREWIDALRTPA